MLKTYIFNNNNSIKTYIKKKEQNKITKFTKSEQITNNKIHLFC
ncbi:hypothetical protein C548_222 [Candidatus Portiera aleyrodidarum BT-QVLC]|nr:hypothetical protein C548_222 [Candidatus Portiera aleyrodidarum BT-QVLC]